MERERLVCIAANGAEGRGVDGPAAVPRGPRPDAAGDRSAGGVGGGGRAAAADSQAGILSQLVSLLQKPPAASSGIQGAEAEDPAGAQFAEFITTAHENFEAVACFACSTRNVARYNFCWKCGRRPQRVEGAAHAKQPKPIVIDYDRLNACRAQVQAAMKGRPGQVRKAKVAGDFDAFIRARSGERIGWEEAAPNGVFDWLF